MDLIKPYSKVKNTSFEYPDVSIKWYEDGTLNVAANCIDRHLATRADQVAILWEGDDPGDDKAITYKELHKQVCKLSNVMKSYGVKKGDRVTLYMPMIPLLLLGSASFFRSLLGTRGIHVIGAKREPQA